MKRIKVSADAHFLRIALIVCLVLVPIAGLIYIQGGIGPLDPERRIGPVLGNALGGNRSQIYATLASMYGSLLGFSITVTSIILSLSPVPRLTILRQSKSFPVLGATLNATIRVLAVATLVSLGCLLFDRENAPSAIWVVALVSVVCLSIAYLWRTLWILENIVKLVTRKDLKSAPSALPTGP